LGNRFLCLFAFCGALLCGAPLVPSPDAIVENYELACRSAENSLRGASMQVEIDAGLPKLKKRGRLLALRHISSLGRITYDSFQWQGDKTIKNNVIARYLQAEAQAQSDRAASLAVTPANYKFRYKGTLQDGARRVHVFRVVPRKKRAGLFKGELWIDSDTYLPVRESGRLVKNPSIFLKAVRFVRTYDIRDGILMPRQIQSIIYTRLIGKAELLVDFTHYSLVDHPRAAGLLEAGGQ
jgi:hypothetical protein